LRTKSDSLPLQAKKSETIGAIAGGIAHDLNNILLTISGYSEMLRDDLPESSASSEKAAMILEAVSKARSLTNHLINLSRQSETVKIPVRVSDVLKETIGFIITSFPDNIKLRCRITEKEAIVSADPVQLFRVFLNLMTNAIRSMEKEGGTLSINLALMEGKLVHKDLNREIYADEYALLTFSDTGKGIEPSISGRIFEPFFTTREEGKGTGLGLSVVRGIVTELEGDIVVSYKKTKGSVFSVYLPVSGEFSETPGEKEKNK